LEPAALVWADDGTTLEEEFASMVEKLKARLLSNKRFDFRHWQPDAFHEYTTAHVRREVSQNVSCPTFQEYVDATQVGALS
jgi:hypothetical protein